MINHKNQIIKVFSFYQNIIHIIRLSLFPSTVSRYVNFSNTFMEVRNNFSIILSSSTYQEIYCAAHPFVTVLISLHYVAVIKQPLQQPRHRIYESCATFPPHWVIGAHSFQQTGLQRRGKFT